MSVGDLPVVIALMGLCKALQYRHYRAAVNYKRGTAALRHLCYGRKKACDTALLEIRRVLTLGEGALAAAVYPFLIPAVRGQLDVVPALKCPEIALSQLLAYNWSLVWL